MMEQTTLTKEELDLRDRERPRTFVERMTGVVLGTVAGLAAGKSMFKKSLRERLRNQLHMRDFTVHNENGVRVDKFEDWIDKVKAGNGVAEAMQLTGDDYVKNAFKSLVEASPPVFTRAKEAFLQERERLHHNYKQELGKLDEKVLKGWNDLRSNYAEDLKKLPKEAVEERGRLLKGYKEALKQFKQPDMRERDYIFQVDEARREKFFKPLFDEMMKPGQEPGHMGFTLRHAKDKNRIIALSVVTGVAVGVVAAKSMKWYLHRNDKRDEARSHEQKLMAERQTADVTPARVAM